MLIQAPGLAAAFFFIWLVLVSAYLAGSFASAVSVATKQGWSLLPVLPVVFATYHLSYGLGFLLGIFCSSASPGRPNPGRTALRALPK
jgi:succinate dehydrogenase hydrophobic anchor subunit